MANPTVVEKIQARFNAKRTESGLAVVDFSGYTMSLPETYTGPQSNVNTVIYCTPIPSSNTIGRLKIFLERLNFSEATGISVVRGSNTRIVQLLPQLSIELGITLVVDDIVDDVLPVGASFTLTASSSNRLFTGSTTVTLE